MDIIQILIIIKLSTLVIFKVISKEKCNKGKEITMSKDCDIQETHMSQIIIMENVMDVIQKLKTNLFISNPPSVQLLLLKR